MPTEHRQPIEPHGEIVKILTITIRCLTNANAARPSENANHVSNQRFRSIEVFALTRFTVQRDEENKTEGIGPQISEAVWPDALRMHPIQLGDDIARVFADCHRPEEPNERVQGRQLNPPEALA